MKLEFTKAPHVIRALKYLKDTPRAMLFMTMGARKTSTILAHVEEMGFEKVMIICLKDNIKTWADEMEKWLINPSYTMIRGTAPKKRKLIKEFSAQYMVINYDSVKPSSVFGIVKGDRVRVKTNKAMRDLMIKQSAQFDLVVFDESLELANYKSERTKALLKVVEGIPRRIIMDGEPTVEGEKSFKSIFTQYFVCDGGATFGRTFWNDFQPKYFVDAGKPWREFKLRAGSKQRLSRLISASAFVYTEEELDREIGLPTRLAFTIYPELTPPQRRYYKELSEKWITTLDSGETIILKWVIEQSMKLRQILDGFILVDGVPVDIPCGKLKSLERLLTLNFRKAKKIVVWCAFVHSIDLVCSLLKKLDIGHRKYWGEMSDVRKDEARNSFQDNEIVRVMVAQGGCGIGLNEFVVANVSFYYSNTDRRRHRAQSEKRTIRPTQKKKNCYIVDFVCAPIEQTILDRSAQKKADSKYLLSYKDRKQLRKEIM